MKFCTGFKEYNLGKHKENLEFQSILNSSMMKLLTEYVLYKKLINSFDEGTLNLKNP